MTVPTSAGADSAEEAQARADAAAARVDALQERVDEAREVYQKALDQMAGAVTVEIDAE